MKIHRLHKWDIVPKTAAALQRELASRVDITTPLSSWDLVACADVSYERFSNLIFAAVIVWQQSTGKIVEQKWAMVETKFPYVSGMLTFREGPALVAAFAKVRTTPDVVMIDGQGIAHPRRIGLATHIGLWLDRPTIGVAKTRLAGAFEPVGEEAGQQSPLILGNDIVGTVLRTRRRSRPLFISSGHRIDLQSAVKVIKDCLKGRRLPEPARMAHEVVNEVRRANRLGQSGKL